MNVAGALPGNVRFDASRTDEPRRSSMKQTRPLNNPTGKHVDTVCIEEDDMEY